MLIFQVQGAVFDLPEDIAKELLNQQTPPGNTISKITKVGFVFLFLAHFATKNGCLHI